SAHQGCRARALQPRGQRMGAARVFRAVLRETAMAETSWRDAVTVVRADALHAQRGASGLGRVTAFDFAGSGGQRTWIGTVVQPPGANTGPHHHGRHEVAIYVVQGRSEIRWGERLEYAVEIGPGDFVYFAPAVPHQEINLAA